MRYVAAYVLSSLSTSGKEPTAADIEKILSSVGVESDKDRVSKICTELKGKSVEELITEGRGKISSVPMGGGAAVAGTPAAATGATPPAAAEKKEEKKEEKEDSDQSDDDMGFGLFD